MKIKINCTGTELIPIDKFTELQGNLKELSKENYEKLKASIIKYGFSFPIFCWKDKKTYYILDAHQRIKTLKKLIEDGYTIPDLPTVFIFADNRKQAGEKLLLLNSQYGEITYTGFNEFIGDFDINFDEINELLNFEITELETGDSLSNKGESIYKDSIYLTPQREYVLIICDEKNSEWEELKMKLDLKYVQRGGKKGGLSKEYNMEKCISAKRILNILNNVNSDTEQE